MKKSVCLYTCLLFIGISAGYTQSIQKTQWKSFFEDPIKDTITINFTRDTSIITSSKSMELVRSFFHTSHDTISINDVGGRIGCIGDGEGLYRFTISGNILTMTIISDPCDGRANALSGRKWIKSGDF